MDYVREQLKDPVQTVQDLSELASKVREGGREEVAEYTTL